MTLSPTPAGILATAKLIGIVAHGEKVANFSQRSAKAATAETTIKMRRFSGWNRKPQKGGIEYFTKNTQNALKTDHGKILPLTNNKNLTITSIVLRQTVKTPATEPDFKKQTPVWGFHDKSSSLAE
ncbi:MAG: hypothetical protein OEY01_09885 [Desulfobulbaceae bacterium]|nr:hypothetical protein [Desulfobulbaceae bacterium]HIJ79282.1 hypothetical protein [Deltaproteobacteria bacterium]